MNGTWKGPKHYQGKNGGFMGPNKSEVGRFPFEGRMGKSAEMLGTIARFHRGGKSRFSSMWEVFNFGK